MSLLRFFALPDAAPGLCLAAVLANAPAAAAPVDEREVFAGVWEMEFHSRVLEAPRKFALVVPPSLRERTGDWPVLFLLHGRGRTHRTLVNLESMRADFLSAPFCTVFPQGDDGWYIDSPADPASRYEQYVKEVIALAGEVRPLSRDASRRGITGWSMGGYGAVRFATRNPEQFGIVAAMIGLLDFPRPATLPQGQNYTVPAARFGADPEVWSRFNPLADAESLRGKAVLIVTAADAFDRTMNEHFHVRLRELGIAHEYLVLPGGHTFEVVQAAVPRVIEFVGRHMDRTVVERGP